MDCLLALNLTSLIFIRLNLNKSKPVSFSFLTGSVVFGDCVEVGSLEELT
jgi:hypothetical protein